MYNLTISIDPGLRQPMYEQLYRYFADEIAAGRLRKGEKLPSKRALCAHLGVSRTTVETAYSILVSEGYVRSSPKSGYYVSELLPFSGEAAQPLPDAPESAGRAEKREFDFSTASVDTSLFPYSSWAKLNREVVYSSPELLQRGSRQGDEPLRRALCAFLAEYRGVSCSPEQIVVGAGMEYLTEILVQLFPGNAAFGVEDPGYVSVYHTLKNSGRSLRFIPLDSEGMDVSRLEKSGAAVAYVTPSHQFPLGLTMPVGRRTQLLRWAESAPGRYIVEDDYDSEFRYFSRPVPAMQGLDRAGRVVYIGTFSRSLAPSIRVAYMVLPPELLERYRALFSHSLSTVSRYEQAVMARFIGEGFYARYLRRVGNLYRQRRQALVDGLRGIDGLTVSGDSGGLHFLLTLPRYNEKALVSRAEGAGIRLRGLSGYCRECAPRPSTLVVGFGGLDDGKIPRAVELLKSAWE